MLHIEKKSDIRAALQGIDTAENIFPRFLVAAAHRHGTGFHKFHEKLGTIGIHIFKSLGKLPLHLAVDHICLPVECVLDIAGKIIKRLWDIIHGGNSRKRAGGLRFHLIA